MTVTTKKALAAAVAAVGLVAGPALPANAGAPTPVGSDCSSSSMTDLSDPSGDTMIANIDGGPFAVADLADPTANPVRVTLTCSLQVGYEDHTGPDVVSVSGSGIGVAVVPTTLAPYSHPPGQPGYLCTQLTVTNAHGETHDLYFDGWNFEFSTDPTVSCMPYSCQAMFSECNNGWRHLRRTACRALIGLAPGVPGVVDIRPDGDLHVLDTFVWDCPPFA